MEADGGQDDRAWVAAVTGGTVTRFEQATAGRSRATWLVDVDRDGQTLGLVLRRDTGDGPLSGTELSLERESKVYRALEGTGVLIPRLLGVAPDGLALLVARVPGTENLASLRGEERDEVIESFLQAVAALHLVDAAALDLAGFERPATPEAHALADLGLWRGVFEDNVRRPAPLVRLAFRWLSAHPPAAVDRTVLCHGDLGPGNFLYQDGQLTALLDWEFAHLGDPMDDLAWFTIRCSQLTDLGDLRHELARYADLTGIKVDADRVRYYQLFVLVRMAVACLVALDKRAGRMDASTYFALLPLLERQMTTLLAELSGIALAPGAVPAPSPPTTQSEILDALANDLGTVLLPELQTPAARSRVMGMSLLLTHLQAAAVRAARFEQADLDDLAQLLGNRPADLPEGQRALGELVDASSPDDIGALLAYFSAHADREVALWPVLAGLAARPLPRADTA